MATGHLRFNIDPELHEELQRALAPWGAQKAVFAALAEWIIEVRNADEFNQWLGSAMDGRLTGGELVALGESLRNGGLKQ